MEPHAVILMNAQQSLSTLLLIIIIGIGLTYTYSEFELWLAWRRFERQGGISRQAQKSVSSEIRSPRPAAAAAVAGPARRRTGTSNAPAYDWREQGL